MNKEITNKRPSFLSKWVRINLPDYEHDGIPIIISDIDFIIMNKRTKKMMIIEEKQGNSKISWSFKTNIMKTSIEAWTDWCQKNEWEFCGYHVFRLINDKFYLNEKEITEKEMREFFGMGDTKIILNSILRCF